LLKNDGENNEDQKAEQSTECGPFLRACLNMIIGGHCWWVRALKTMTDQSGRLFQESVATP